MSVFNASSSGFGSFATPLPACDAWGNILLGNASTATSLVAGSGISNVQRISTGVHGVTFSDANRFGSGAYVFLITPEYSSQSVGPFIVGGVKQGGVTAPGFSAGFALSCFGFQNPAVAGGYTIDGPLDASANTLWANVAAFSFKTTRDLYDPYVANLIQNSEDISASPWFNFILGTGLNPVIVSDAEPNPIDGVTNADLVTFDIGSASVDENNWSFRQQNITFNSDFKGITGANGMYTWSLWAKLGPAGTTLSVRSVDGTAYTNITLTPTWRRYSGTFQIADTASTQMVGVQMGVRGNYGGAATTPRVSAYIWGVQVEPGSVASPYTKTSTTYPVFGNQDAKKRFVPGASGYGLTGATYGSSIVALNSTRTPTAYGTIVVPARRGSTTDPVVAAYIEQGFNVSGVSAGDFSVFDVTFSKPLKTANYCVILSRETEPEFATTDHAQTYEYAITAIDRSNKTANGFRAFTLKQSTVNNGMVKSGVAHSSGLNERIHFMVFGGGTYGQA
jgi:hypothetical protein